MVAHVTTRRKPSSVYRYASYRCSFATHKGPAVCTHSTGYRQERLEGALLARFREAMTAPIVDTLTRAINMQIESAFRHLNTRSAGTKAEMLRLEREAGNLVRFLAAGNDSPTVRDELKALETALQGLRAELSDLEKTVGLATPRVHQAWVMAKLERIEELLRQDPARARAEIAKHLDGDLVV